MPRPVWFDDYSVLDLLLDLLECFVAADNRLFSIAGVRNERSLDSAGYLRTAGSAESEFLLEVVPAAALGKSVPLLLFLGGVDVVSP